MFQWLNYHAHIKAKSMSLNGVLAILSVKGLIKAIWFKPHEYSKWQHPWLQILTDSNLCEPLISPPILRKLVPEDLQYPNFENSNLPDSLIYTPMLKKLISNFIVSEELQYDMFMQPSCLTVTSWDLEGCILLQMITQNNVKSSFLKTDCQAASSTSMSSQYT